MVVAPCLRGGAATLGVASQAAVKHAEEEGDKNTGRQEARMEGEGGVVMVVVFMALALASAVLQHPERR